MDGYQVLEVCRQDPEPQHGVDRIKTIGETYMAAAGVPRRREDHAEAVAELALAMQLAVTRVDVRPSQPLSLRIGINTGPVMARVIGTTRFAYELWGPTVTTAAQMEAYGLGGAIQVSAATHARLRDASGSSSGSRAGRSSTGRPTGSCRSARSSTSAARSTPTSSPAAARCSRRTA
jgi:class 3 adenylate cyclase